MSPHWKLTATPSELIHGNEAQSLLGLNPRNSCCICRPRYRRASFRSIQIVKHRVPSLLLGEPLLCVGNAGCETRVMNVPHNEFGSSCPQSRHGRRSGRHSTRGHLSSTARVPSSVLDLRGINPFDGENTSSFLTYRWTKKAFWFLMAYLTPMTFAPYTVANQIPAGCRYRSFRLPTLWYGGHRCKIVE